jgi:hypothetical protein
MRASGPSAPKAPPAPIESLQSADEELKKLTGKNFASGGGRGDQHSGAFGKVLGRFGAGGQKNDRIQQLMGFIEDQMGGLDAARKSGGSGQQANTFAGKRKTRNVAQADPSNTSQVLL